MTTVERTDDGEIPGWVQGAGANTNRHLWGMSPRQKPAWIESMKTLNARKLSAALDRIWKKGDQDECSIKHIQHACAAMTIGKNWSEGVDYCYPTTMFSFYESETYYGLKDKKKEAEMEAAKLKQISAAWDPIQEWVDLNGTEAFYDLWMKTKFGSFGIDGYIRDALHYGNDGDLPDWAEISDATNRLAFQKKET